MATPSGFPKAVLLRLSAVDSSDPKLLYPERRITLSEENKSISIGRASQVSSKGFIAGVNNAWFDSPVISRYHAEVSASMDSKKLEIVDKGSLHGTYVNGGNRVPTNERRELKDGDTLTFGAPIWRATQEFHPVTVTVGFRFPDPASDGSSTFQVPEGSDDDATDDDMSSGSDVNGKNTNGHGRPQNSFANTVAKAQVIDLTGGVGGRRTREVIDLSSPCGSPIRVADEDETSNDFADAPVPADFEVDEPPVPQNLEDGADQEEYDLDTAFDHDGPIDSMDDESDRMPDVYDDYESDEDENSLGDLEDVGDTDDMDSEEDYLSDDVYGVDNGSSGDHSDDGWGDDEALETEFPEIMPLIQSLSGPSMTSPPINVIEATTKNVTNCSIECLLNGDRPQQPQQPAHSPHLDTSPAGQQYPINSYQEPSPPSGFHPTPYYPPSSAATLEALGEKTGKTAFFLAREQNKMAMDALRGFNTRPASSVHALCNVEEPANEPAGFTFGPAAHGTEEEWLLLGPRPSYPEPRFVPGLGCRAPLIDSRPPPPMEAGPEPMFSTNPDQPLDELPQALGSPVSLGGDVEVYSRRTHMEISDIVDTCQPSVSEGKKRKAEAISETTDEQEQWAAKAAKALSPALSEEEHAGLSKQQPEVPEQQVNEVPEALPTPPARDNETTPVAVDEPAVPERPVKRARMMRIAERLGYAALGGVTAGAMVLGTLIYTAPTFS